MASVKSTTVLRDEVQDAIARIKAAKAETAEPSAATLLDVLLIVFEDVLDLLLELLL
jgi:hypothetical protein